MKGYWRGDPGKVNADSVRITTRARTDLWQRTFYGFQVSNASAYLMPCVRNQTFSVEVSFDYQRRYDQAGVIIWVDENNWFKAAIEYENSDVSRLGSVLTTAGYSDWATRDIPTVGAAAYRLSRRGPDFLLEGRGAQDWEQMRVFHMAALGQTTLEMAAARMSGETAARVDIGVYAASPEESSFEAVFTGLTWEPSRWQAHS